MAGTRVVVYHDTYGCESGCCGHVVELDDGSSYFSFSHPYGEDKLEYAKRLIEEAYGIEHVKNLDWEDCKIYDD